MMTTDLVERYESLSLLMERMGAEAPPLMQAFGSMHQAAVEDGALDTGTKELIALAIGIAVHCDGCITYHVHDALKAGVTREQIIETIGVAIMMGGGPSVVYGCEALTAVDQWIAAEVPQ
jgi:AhpD family alkylhydroperoxidase